MKKKRGKNRYLLTEYATSASNNKSTSSTPNAKRLFSHQFSVTALIDHIQ